MKRRSGIGENGLELRALAMRRSGHHAVLNWICLHFKNRVCWINDASQYSFDNSTIFTYPNLKQYAKYRKRFNKACEKSVFMDEGRYDIIADDKRCLLHSYEDKELKEVQDYFDRQHNGKSKRIVTLIVIRDPYNQTASRCKKATSQMIKKGRSPDGLANIMTNKGRSRSAYFEMMKSYYRECLGETNILKGEKLVLNYNKWFKSADYRKSISEYFGLAFGDRGKEYIINIGQGSSFDKMRKHNMASRMNVLKRWVKCRNRSVMQELFRDEELARLSKALFGDIL